MKKPNKRLKKLIDAAGKGQAELAEEIGVSYTHLSRWINDASRVPLKIYRKNMQRVLGEDPYE